MTRSNRHAAVRLVAALVLLSGSACAAAPKADTGKGAEDAIPVDGKLDGFGSPTDHGTLALGATQTAEVADGAIFHAWTFTLSGEADIDLRTALVTPNLDTVMYLYRRDPGTSAWGHYIARNDDVDGSVASHIHGHFTAGEYRVLVKPYKESMRGTFELHSACTGDGCGMGMGMGTATCVPATARDLPAQTDFTQACVDAIVKAMTGVGDVHGQASVKWEERGSLPCAAEAAVEWYHAYWDDNVGWDSFVDTADNGPATIDVTWQEGGDGTMFVLVDAGPDEGSMALLIDSAGKLVMFDQIGESTDVQYFCGTSGATVEKPDDFCMDLAMRAAPHAATDEQPGQYQGAGSGVPGDAVPAKAYAAYAMSHMLMSTTPVDMHWSAWSNADAETAAGNVRLDGHDAAPAETYFVVDEGGYDNYLVSVTAADGTVTLPCQTL